MKAFRRLRHVGIALAIVMLVGTAGFHHIEGWSWFDGFYMVVTTLTTIGYQETHPLSHAGRVFNISRIGSCWSEMRPKSRHCAKRISSGRAGWWRRPPPTRPISTSFLPLAA